MYSYWLKCIDCFRKNEEFYAFILFRNSFKRRKFERWSSFAGVESSQSCRRFTVTLKSPFESFRDFDMNSFSDRTLRTMLSFCFVVYCKSSWCMWRTAWGWVPRNVLFEIVTWTLEYNSYSKASYCSFKSVCMRTIVDLEYCSLRQLVGFGLNHNWAPTPTTPPSAPTPSSSGPALGSFFLRSAVCFGALAQSWFRSEKCSASNSVISSVAGSQTASFTESSRASLASFWFACFWCKALTLSCLVCIWALW